MELRHCLDKPFQPQSEPPHYIHTSLHVRRLGCLWGVWAWGQTRKGAKRKQQCPGYTHCTPPWTQDPPLPLPSQAFHIGQASLRFRAFECDSSSPPACDEPNSSGLPTHRVVSPSSLLILGLQCTQAEGLPVSDMERHTAKSTQL